MKSATNWRMKPIGSLSQALADRKVVVIHEMTVGERTLSRIGDQAVSEYQQGDVASAEPASAAVTTYDRLPARAPIPIGDQRKVETQLGGVPAAARAITTLKTKTGLRGRQPFQSGESLMPAACSLFRVIAETHEQSEVRA